MANNNAPSPKIETENTPEEDLIMMAATSLGLATPLEDDPDMLTVDMEALEKITEVLTGIGHKAR